MAVTQGELNQKLLEDLLKIQIKAEQKMLEKVAKRAKRGATTPGWNEQKLKDVQSLRQDILKILNDKNKLEKTYIQKTILKAYETAGNKVSKILLKSPESAMKNMIPLHLQHLILETNKAIAGTSFQVLRNIDDEYRSIIADTTSGLLIGTDTRLQVTQEALNNFAAKGITGFVDKAGRNWELASYVEMAVRTASSRAALQGHVDRSMELGQDLMLVSGHAATCPICAPWGNQVISITGKTPNYPTLATAQEAGLFHPNCKHTLTVWFEGLEGNQEHLDEYKQESNPELYKAIQRQRYNERQIRMYKRLEAVAITPEAQLKASNKIEQWQAIQREHIKQFNLKRNYARESIKNRVGDATKASVEPDITGIYRPMEKTVKAREDITEVHADPPDNTKKILFSYNNDGKPSEYSYAEIKEESLMKKKILLKNNTDLKLSDLHRLSLEEIDDKVKDLFKDKKDEPEAPKQIVIKPTTEVKVRPRDKDKDEPKVEVKPKVETRVDDRERIFFYHGNYSREEIKDMHNNLKFDILASQIDKKRYGLPEDIYDIQEFIKSNPEKANKVLEEIFEEQSRRSKDVYTRYSRVYSTLNTQEVDDSIETSRDWFDKSKNEAYRKSLRTYTGSAYEWMNSYYRSDRQDYLGDNYRKIVENAEKAFDHAPRAFEKDSVLYRATGFSYFRNAGVPEELEEATNSFLKEFKYADTRDTEKFNKNKNLLEEALKNVMIGVKVPEKSFTSTSYRKGAFGRHKPVQLTIAASVEKSKAVQLSAISEFGSSEAEILFAPNMINEIKDVYFEDDVAGLKIRIEVEVQGHE